MLTYVNLFYIFKNKNFLLPKKQEFAIAYLPSQVMLSRFCGPCYVLGIKHLKLKLLSPSGLFDTLLFYGSHLL